MYKTSPAEAAANFQDWAAASGYELHDFVWLGALHQYEATCPKGHACKPTPSMIQRGRGGCVTCGRAAAARTRAKAAEARFTAAVESLGGRVMGPYVNGRTPVLIACRDGHSGHPLPLNVIRGRGICQQCVGRIWDVFYVVAGNGLVKFGITSGDPKARLDTHKRDGLPNRLFVRTGLPDGHARNLEVAVMDALKRADCTPARGREYFPIECLGLILDLARAALPDTTV